MITVSPRRARSFDGYLQLFHWTELIQSSPLAVERAVYEVVGGAYRRNNVTTMELRFNPMKRNRGGEQDLDHIISAATRGMDRAKLEYPVTPGSASCASTGPSRTSSTRSSWRRPSPTRRAGSWASTSRVPSRRPSGPRSTGGCSTGPGARAWASRSTPASPDRWRRSARSSGSWSRHASATASRPPTTRARMDMIRGAGHHAGDLPHQQPQHPGGVRLGRVPLDLRHLPPAPGPVHHQHRWPGDAQDLHPGRVRDPRSAGHPVRGGAAAVRRMGTPGDRSWRA